MMISFVPSLRHAAIVSVISSFLKQPDWVSICLNQDYFKEYEGYEESEFLQAHDELANKIEKLDFPMILKTEICKYAHQVVENVFDWIRWGETFFLEIDRENFLSAACLTNMGTVDQRKSAELLLKNKNINLEERYLLACACCLEEHIRELWLQLCNPCINSQLFRLYHPSYMQLVRYWTYKIKLDINEELEAHDQYYVENEIEYFKAALQSSNSLAAHYFWRCLSLPQKISVLDNWERKAVEPWSIYYVEFLFLTLPLVDRKQQDQWFRTAAFNILKAFNKWPWCYFVVNVAENLCKYLSAADYFNLFNYFFKESCENIECIEGILRTSPRYLRRSLFEDKSNFCSILFNFLLLRNNTDCAKFLISDLDDVEKEQLVFSEEFTEFMHLNAFDRMSYHLDRESILDHDEDEQLVFSEEFRKKSYLDEENFRIVINFVCEYVISKEQHSHWIHEFRQRLALKINVDSMERIFSRIQLNSTVDKLLLATI